MHLLLGWVLLTLPKERGIPAHRNDRRDLLTLAFVGDVMLGRGVATAVDTEWKALFAEVSSPLIAADVSIANLESPLTTAPQRAEGLGPG